MSAHVSRLRAMLRRWFRGASASERALDDEIASVLQHEIDARVADGLSPAEAARTARAAFGSMDPIKEHVREAQTGAVIESVARDARYAWRGIRRSPGLTIAVVGSLAIGLAITVAAMAFVESMLFGSYPGISNQAQLVNVVARRGPRPIGNTMPSEDDYLALRAGLDGLQGLAAFTSTNVVAVLPEPRSLLAFLVSANYFDVFGTRPVLGRTFSADEDRAAVVVISHRLWRQDFAGDPSVIGRTIRVGDAPVTIVGVAPAGFGGTTPGIGDIWMPLAMGALVAPDSTSMPGRERQLQFLGRLKAGASHAQIQAEVASVAQQRLAAQGIRGRETWGVISGVSGIEPDRRAQFALVVMLIPLLVLVTACLNASALLLARGARRSRELAIRLAIGAGRGRIVRQLVIESLLLTTMAAAIGTLLAWWGLQIAGLQFSILMPIDAAVLLATLLVTAVCAVVCGLVPAMRVTARAPFRALGAVHGDAGGTRPIPKGRPLIVVQVALSIGVLATATQLVTLVASQGGSGGTPSDRLLMASFDLDQLRFEPEAADRFYAALVDRASRLPGVEHAGLARRTAVWTFGHGKGPASLVVWQPGERARGGTVVLGGYAGGDLFDALGLAIIEGRGFQAADRMGFPRVAIVNQAYAREMQGPVLGRTLRVHGYVQRAKATSDEEFKTGRDVEIVGIMQSASEPFYSRDGEAVPKIYLPTPLQAEPALTLYVSTRRDAETLAGPIRDLTHAIDPRVPIVEMGSLVTFNEQLMGPLVWMARAGAGMGLLAMLLTALGLLAVVSYAVAVRGREFAIRMALGSQPRSVLALVLRQAMRIVAIGFVIGAGLALLATKLLQTQFRGAQGLDVTAFASATALLVAVMFLASAVPAIRAARVDPVAALKEG
jgi:predicted permease